MHGQTFGLNEICWITGFGKTKETDGERQMLDCVLCVCLTVYMCFFSFFFYLYFFVAFILRPFLFLQYLLEYLFLLCNLLFWFRKTCAFLVRIISMWQGELMYGLIQP